jgi:signal transduction histidine kinase
MNKRLLCFLLVTFFVSVAKLRASEQEKQLIENKERQAILERYREQADKFFLKNLNRFALDQLGYYDRVLDTLYKAELNDKLSSFKKNYETAHHDRIELLHNLNEEIKVLEKSRDESSSKATSLLSRGTFLSVISLCSVLLIVLWRYRVSKLALRKLEQSEMQLEASEKLFAVGNELLASSSEEIKRSTQVETKSAEISKLFSSPDFFSENISKEETTELKTLVKSLARLSSLNTKLLATSLTQEKDFGTEYLITDINKLCDQCTDLVYYGMQTAENNFTCSVTKDLEKNLRPIKIIPEAVSHLLLNILSNSFVAVNEKQLRNIKGYQPKVSISTRVLPSFHQIRIKDNGDGIKDEVIAKMFDPFYTTRKDGEGSGLGMYFAKQIISTMHKGEIKIESHPTNGTDVYIKFFTTS